jgi:hypothetical protein
MVKMHLTKFEEQESDTPLPLELHEDVELLLERCEQ